MFRTSFGIMTVDNSGPGGFDEYAGNFNILQPTGDPRQVFQLSAGPGPIHYPVNADGTVPYTGASFGSRTATLRDPNLRNPYIMNWSAGFQGQLSRHLDREPDVSGHVRRGTDAQLEHQLRFRSRSLWAATVPCRTRSLRPSRIICIIPQFGTINYLSNFNHNTWHSGNITVDKRYGNGLTVQRQLQHLQIAEQRRFPELLQPPGQSAHLLRSAAPVRRLRDLRTAGRQEANAGSIGAGWPNAIFGGWKVDVSENALSGMPISVTHAGSPNRYLTASRVNATGAHRIRRRSPIGTWGSASRPPRRIPTSISDAFAYPDSYTIGSLGSRVLQAPAALVDAVFCHQELDRLDERYKFSFRLDGHNLPVEAAQSRRSQYHLQSEQHRGLGQVHRRGRRFFQLRHGAGQHADVDSRGVLDMSRPMTRSKTISAQSSQMPGRSSAALLRRPAVRPRCARSRPGSRSAPAAGSRPPENMLYLKQLGVTWVSLGATPETATAEGLHQDARAVGSGRLQGL